VILFEINEFLFVDRLGNLFKQVWSFSFKEFKVNGTYNKFLPSDIVAFISFLQLSDIADLTPSQMKKSKEKNRLQWIETKEILFMACVKFQESFKLSPDQITLLEQWGDTLLLISTNYLVPLHELACEKFMQVM
jgi:hypothetical protein